MNDIRYEPVFGDQTWFDDGPEDAEMIAIYAHRAKRWYKIQYGQCYYSIGKGQPWKRCRNGCPRLPLRAQRRIIRVPTWTKADQLAGKLPPVGAMVKEKGIEFCGGAQLPKPLLGFPCVVIGIYEDEVCLQFDDGSMRLDTLNNIEPVETPEERQQRKRAEWAKVVVEEICVSTNNDPIEMVSCIYDSLLSGELKMPEVQK